jgi:hypothetical protein
MTLSDDLQGEMRDPWLDDDTADRLLAGLIAPDDAPPGYAQVARIVRAAVAAPSARELARQGEHVAAAGRAVSAARIAPRPMPRRASVGSRFQRTKIVATLVVGTLAGTTGLAMASVLPGPAQDAVSGVLAKVGISVPSSLGNPASTGEEISHVATTTESTGVDKGAEISGIASGGMSQAGQHGAGQEGAPQNGKRQDDVKKPDSAGSAPIPDSSVGDEHSSGHSAEGSGNAPDPSAPPTP